MKYSFRDYHLLEILNAFDHEDQRLPLDRFLSQYFRQHTAVGSKDRKSICKSLYDMIRWRSLLDHLSARPLSWDTRLKTYLDQGWKRHQNDQEIPLHVRLSFPKPFFQFLVSSLGEERAVEFARISNTEAPTTIRVNPTLTSREALMNKWDGLYPVSRTTTSPLGITFQKRENFFGMPEFNAGLFEVQDEASQLLAELMDVQPGDQVLDYCAGSGGKSLAFAHKMENSGQLYLHDRRKSILLEAKKRLKRAQVQHAQIIQYDDKRKASLKGMMDWVLVDAPCSGSGTLRRNPDMKWRFSPEMVERLVTEQQAIFQDALTFLKDGGKIVYATCSVFPEENHHQVDAFQKTFSLQVETVHESFPIPNGMDGMFGAVLSKK